MNEAKFWASMQKVEKGCWNWTRAVGSGGYGQVSFRGSSWGAHRLAWTLARAPIVGDGAVVAHRCDNRLCCNPEHLFLTDAKGNQQDCLMKGRATAAKLSESQVIQIIAAIQAGESTRSIAARFGVFGLTIRAIAKRKSWRHLTEATGELKLAPRRANPEKHRTADYDLIISMLDSGKTIREIARRCHTTHTTVRRVMGQTGKSAATPFKRLTVEDRTRIRTLKVTGISNQAIADQLGISQASVSRTLTAAGG